MRLLRSCAHKRLSPLPAVQYKHQTRSKNMHYVWVRVIGCHVQKQRRASYRDGSCRVCVANTRFDSVFSMEREPARESKFCLNRRYSWSGGRFFRMAHGVFGWCMVIRLLSMFIITRTATPEELHALKTEDPGTQIGGDKIDKIAVQFLSRESFAIFTAA